MFVEAMMQIGELLFQRREFERGNLSSRSTSYTPLSLSLSPAKISRNFTETTQLRFSSYFLSSKSLLFLYSVLEMFQYVSAYSVCLLD